jgi:pentatricopeptide repeat protein
VIEGKLIHAHIIQTGFQCEDVILRNILVTMYAKCGVVEDAWKVFDKITERDVVSWTVMIAAYVRHGFADKALCLFYEMRRSGVQPNQFTFASVLPVCADLRALKDVHEDIIRGGFELDTFVGSALVDMYAKCGSIEDACNVFDKLPQRDVVAWNAMIAGYVHNGCIYEAKELFEKMPKRDVVSWTAMIAGYAQNGQAEEALKLFREMYLAYVELDSGTLATVLASCANLAVMEHGRQVHEVIIRSGFGSNVFVGSALVDMYAKCGSIENAHKAFDKMSQRTVVSWNAMIVGYAMHGCGKEALELFEQMQLSGTNPDNVTFVGVLSACCHTGQVEKGRRYFDYITQYYHLTPTMENYGCMVDLLGRVGCLDEAEDLINKMPFQPDATVLGCLLGACRIHSNVVLGERVAERLFALDTKCSAPYVLLSNIYAAAGRWGDIEKVRKMMKDRKVTKTPGCSWIEVNKQVHTFAV